MSVIPVVLHRSVGGITLLAGALAIGPAPLRAQQAATVVPGVGVHMDAAPGPDTVVFRRSITRGGGDSITGTRMVVSRVLPGQGGTRLLDVEQRFLSALAAGVLLALATPVAIQSDSMRPALARKPPSQSDTGAQEPSAHDVVDRAEKALWGTTVQAQLTMTVTTPRWERTLELQSWMERPRRSFIRIRAPAKEAGIASLRIGPEMWNYLPTVERTIKVPPSMMLQPWMGSDFSNDDLVKESSMVDDYTHRFVGSDTAGGVAVYVIEALPKPDAAVVWGRLVLRVRKADFLPLRVEYYDERGTLIRVLTYSEIRPIGGRTIPTQWEMRPIAKPGNLTTIVLKRATFDAAIPADVFTQRNLTRR